MTSQPLNPQPYQLVYHGPTNGTDTAVVRFYRIDIYKVTVDSDPYYQATVVSWNQGQDLTTPIYTTRLYPTMDAAHGIASSELPSLIRENSPQALGSLPHDSSTGRVDT
jgi:hypothetical protein